MNSSCCRTRVHPSTFEQKLEEGAGDGEPGDGGGHAAAHLGAESGRGQQVDAFVQLGGEETLLAYLPVQVAAE